MPTILIVDDDDAVRGILFEALSEKYLCHTASRAEEALQYLEIEKYDAILTDVAMPGLDGVSLLKQVLRRDAGTPVILISGRGSGQLAERLMALGAFAYLSKPFDLDELEQVVERAITKPS
jgi:two-component system nitrogen regulation response regulator GlnG